MDEQWEVTAAETALATIVDAALEGRPQVIRRDDGKEVIVVAREQPEASRTSLRDYLLTQGFSEDGEDDFDRAMQEVRARGLHAIAPRGQRV